MALSGGVYGAANYFRKSKTLQQKRKRERERRKNSQAFLDTNN